jgi:hypothetical protein
VRYAGQLGPVEEEHLQSRVVLVVTVQVDINCG